MKKHAVLWWSILAMLCMASPTWAGIQEQSWSFTPFAGGYMYDSEENLDTSLIYGAKLGYDFTKYFGLEMSVGGGRTHVDEDYGDMGVRMVEPRLDSLIYLMPDSAFVPFLSVGIGGRSMKHGDQLATSESDFGDITQKEYDDTVRNAESKHFLVDAGLGAKWFLTKWLALRGDVRYVVPLNDALNNFEATLGLTFVMGGEKPAPVVAPEPEPAPVYVEPAPAPEPKPEPKPAPAPVVVPKPAPTKMEKEIVEQGRATLDVKFKTNSAVILPESHKQLAEFADVMNKYPDLTVEIGGHTDSTGSDKYNMQLSQKRADSVKKYLADKLGVDAKRMTAKGYGETKPIADNKTVAGKAKNRRVEAVVNYEYKVKKTD